MTIFLFSAQTMDENHEKIRQAIDQYLKKESHLHTQFKILFRKNAIESFGCDEQCIDACLSRNYVTFFEIPLCLAKKPDYCACHQEIFTVKKYEKPHLSPINGSGKTLNLRKFFRVFDKLDN